MNRTLWLACVTVAASSPLRAQDLELRLTLTGHTRTVHTVAFSPDGKTLASGGGDEAIKLWDVIGGQKASLS